MLQFRIYTLKSPDALGPEFADDMAGFDVDEIVDVQSVLLDPTSFSPIH